MRRSGEDNAVSDVGNASSRSQIYGGCDLSVDV